MSTTTIKIYTATDEAVEEMRKEIEGDDIEIIDLRTPLRRFYNALPGWAFGISVGFLLVANYCRFKLAVGLSVASCGCS